MAGHDRPVAAHDQPDPGEAEALAAVRSTLWALPESQHQAFVLRHWSGLSQDEIADVLDTTPGAVESLLIRARRTLLEDQNQVRSECSRVRNRLVQALAPTSGEQSHIASCRRCRTAQARLLRASEFASALALVPHPWVAHAIGNAVPGFGTGSAAAATTVTGAAGSGGAGAGLTAASAAAKVGLIAKVSLAAATAVVALGATNPVRNTVSGALFGHRPAHSEVARSRAAAPSDRSGAASGQPPVATLRVGRRCRSRRRRERHGPREVCDCRCQRPGQRQGQREVCDCRRQRPGQRQGEREVCDCRRQWPGQREGCDCRRQWPGQREANGSPRRPVPVARATGRPTASPQRPVPVVRATGRPPASRPVPVRTGKAPASPLSA